MRVLLLGATGNFGSRLLPALQAHGHQITVLVRSQAKLEALIPSSILSKTTVVTGDASDPMAIRSALVNNDCEALINSAGQAAMFPWQAPQMQHIEKATVKAIVEASEQMGKPLRAWWLGGMTVLDYPGSSEAKLSRYFPIFREHALTFELVSSLPVEKVQWSMFCPSAMLPESKSIQQLSEPHGNPLSGAADIPAGIQTLYIDWIPFLGPLMTVMGNAWRYNTTLEDCADFVAEDLTNPKSEYVGHRVSVINVGKEKQK